MDGWAWVSLSAVAVNLGANVVLYRYSRRVRRLSQQVMRLPEWRRSMVVAGFLAWLAENKTIDPEIRALARSMVPLDGLSADFPGKGPMMTITQGRVPWTPLDRDALVGRKVKRGKSTRTIVATYADIRGGVILDLPLAGMKSWNVAELELLDEK